MGTGEKETRDKNHSRARQINRFASRWKKMMCSREELGEEKFGESTSDCATNDSKDSLVTKQKHPADHR